MGRPGSSYVHIYPYFAGVDGGHFISASNIDQFVFAIGSMWGTYSTCSVYAVRPARGLFSLSGISWQDLFDAVCFIRRVYAGHRALFGSRFKGPIDAR